MTCDEDAPPWTGSIGVVLVQPDRPQTVHEAVPATVRWGATPERNGIESRLCTALGLHVLESDVSPLSVQLADSQTVQARPGQKVELPIRAIRRSGAEADCIVRPQQLPPKVGLGEVRIPAKATAAKAQMTIAADARPGRYTFWMLTETQVKWRANPQAVTRIETYLGALRGRLESADEPTRRNLESAIALQTAALEQATKAAAERPITVWIPSTPLELEILPPES